MTALLSLIVDHALAIGLGDTLTEVATGVPKTPFCFGSSCLTDIADRAITDIVKSDIILILGVIFVTIAGLKLVTKSSEDELGNAKRSIGMVFAGVVLASLHSLLFSAAGGGGTVPDATELCPAFLNVIGIFEGLAGILAVIAIAFTGIKVLASFGSEDAVASMRQAVGAVLFGLFILIEKPIVYGAIGLDKCEIVGGASSVAIVGKVLSIIATFMGYLQVVAILILVVLGLLMIVNFGNEEQFTKLKSYLFRLAIGFIIISMARYLIEIFI